jgi:pyridoxamine 5'-phosphate oxidase
VADASSQFDPGTADPDPFERFRRWWDESRAVVAGDDADAMVVATTSRAGEPSARYVILRGFDARGFVFFTNYGSAKAADLAANPRAAVVLYWAPLHRQVRASGPVSKLSGEESAAYFASRPPGHRLAAWASPQSEVVESRAVLERAFADAGVAHGEDPLLPLFWGGYVVEPDLFEFWEGRENRLHDRVRYRREGEGWRIERLAP